MKASWDEVVRGPGRSHMVKDNGATLIAAVPEAGSGVRPPFTLLRILDLGNTIQMWTPGQIWTCAEAIRQGSERR